MESSVWQDWSFVGILRLLWCTARVELIEGSALFRKDTSSTIVSWFAMTSKELNWMDTIWSCSLISPEGWSEFSPIRKNVKLNCLSLSYVEYPLRNTKDIVARTNTHIWKIHNLYFGNNLLYLIKKTINPWHFFGQCTI